MRVCVNFVHSPELLGCAARLVTTISAIIIIFSARERKELNSGRYHTGFWACLAQSSQLPLPAGVRVSPLRLLELCLCECVFMFLFFVLCVHLVRH